MDQSLVPVMALSAGWAAQSLDVLPLLGEDGRAG
jgi:hypothetical protein